MPVYTVPVSNQNTSVSSGIHFYPLLSQLSQFGTFGDIFHRESVNVTNAYALYTTNNGQGNGASSISNQSSLLLSTSGASGDNTCVRTSGLGFSRVCNLVDKRSILNLNIVFRMGANSFDRIFVGLVYNQSGLTSLPTSSMQYMGMKFDAAVDANYKLQSGNGSAQVTTDSGRASAVETIGLNITWTGNNAATMQLYDTSMNLTGNKATVTDLGLLASGTDASAFELYFYVETNAVAVKTLIIPEWSVSCT